MLNHSFTQDVAHITVGGTTSLQDTVNVLLKYNADTNARDKNWQTPLHVASCNNAYHCAKALLAVSPTVNVSDRTGRTALHHASFNGYYF